MRGKRISVEVSEKCKSVEVRSKYLSELPVDLHPLLFGVNSVFQLPVSVVTRIGGMVLCSAIVIL